MNVTNLHPTAADRVEEMRGTRRTGFNVIVEGRAIHCLTMYDRHEGMVSLCLDGRWEIDVPIEFAPRIAWMVANAHAIGQGYSHLGALNKDMPYAPQVRGLHPSALGLSEGGDA